MNDIANLRAFGANVNEVRKGIGSDPRIGTKFIYPGIGYGGSCFPKDVKGDCTHWRAAPIFPSRILSAVDSVNDDQKKVLVQKFSGTLKTI